MSSAPSYGLFGKLPAKRDFVAVDIPQAVLSPWENWLQRVMAESRQRLGSGWLDCFLTAPLWHFQCGARVLGRAATGVMMPSVDGVGRYFPLTAIVCAEDDTEWAMPDFSVERSGAIEALMLKALDADQDYDSFIAALRSLPVAARAHPSAPPILNTVLDSASFAADLQEWCAQSGAASASLWWTHGGEGFSPRLLAVHGLPDGLLFTAMLNGAFSAPGIVEGGA